jgi:hypothetical protein
MTAVDPKRKVTRSAGGVGMDESLPQDLVERLALCELINELV